ncbi:MAG TPA: hypothetical protein VNJ03_13330 [Vicinamibacterales bacterium]|nr:hypothetical protein [Vicinamibacterales bacterium]
MSAHRIGLFLLMTCLCAPIAACKGRTPAPPPATSASPTEAPPTERVVGPLSPEEAAILATMNQRINEYVTLHRKLERKLPQVPREATPEQIDRFQRALEKAVREARAGAKQGELFTPESRVVITRLLATIFGGPDGKELKASVLDETPVGVQLAVNGRYPDTVPMSTIPPQVLQTLPKLAEEMEYRFVGDALVLLDVHAHVIADFIPDALPK